MTPEITINQSLSERIKEFRSDPEKMEVTTRFVNEVVEKAKSEATKRMKEKEGEKVKERVPNTNFEGGGGRKRGRWHSRARGFFSRIMASLCFCSTETQPQDENCKKRKKTVGDTPEDGSPQKKRPGARPPKKGQKKQRKDKGRSK